MRSGHGADAPAVARVGRAARKLLGIDNRLSRAERHARSIMGLARIDISRPRACATRGCAAARARQGARSMRSLTPRTNGGGRRPGGGHAVVSPPRKTFSTSGKGSTRSHVVVLEAARAPPAPAKTGRRSRAKEGPFYTPQLTSSTPTSFSPSSSPPHPLPPSAPRGCELGQAGIRLRLRLGTVLAPPVGYPRRRPGT